MATAHARLIADRINDGQEPFYLGPDISVSSRTFTKAVANDVHYKQSSSSSYVLADDNSINHSQFSQDIEHWMNGSQVPTPVPTTPAAVSTDTGAGERPTAVQRSTLAHSYSLEQYSGIWYILAMFLPLFSVGNCPSWRCTPSVVVNSAELLLSQVSRLLGQFRAQLRQISHDQLAREVFATIMDIILVIYAVGFLVLSMYQASIFA
ncbi:hypothetical protein O0L34_g16944 [Tuta absoluta]|nr:hypothetical protein O0L34_g16944 [Tuta absoluta]